MRDELDELLAGTLASLKAQRSEVVRRRDELLAKLRAQHAELAVQIANLEALNSADAAAVSAIDAKAAALGLDAKARAP